MCLIFKYQNLCCSPNKLRLIIFYYKNRSLIESINHLNLINLKSAFILNKLLKNIKHNISQNNLDINYLFIKNILIDKGRIIKKRYISAKGKSSFLKKKFSHIEIQMFYKKG